MTPAPKKTLPDHFCLGYRETLAFYAKALSAAAEISPEELRLCKRRLGETDLFFLLTFVLTTGKRMLHPWLFKRCREYQADPDGYLDVWAREHFKMLRLDEPTPTPDGWKAHGDLEVGDKVFAPDGSITSVVALSPIYTDGECYEIEFDDGEIIECGAEHLWQVERHTRKRIAGTFKIDGIGKRKYRETVVIPTKDIFTHKHKQDRRLAIAVNAALQLPAKDFPIHPYVLGAWLGDGTSATGDITCGDPELFSICEIFGYEVGHNKSLTRNAACRRIIGLHQELKRLNLTKNKHIPQDYLRGSIEQRLHLLQGLMDTDGTCNTRGTAVFVNTNERLAEGVYELATSLGLKPSRFSYQNDHGDVWQISFQAYSEMCPFLLPRKAARCKVGSRKNPRRMIVACRRIEPVPMRCIQVDREDGMYLTGRAMIPTHNSTIITFGGTFHDIINDPEITACIFSHTKSIARSFLAQIKMEMEQNPRLHELWPEIFFAEPQKQAKKWSLDGGLIVNRSGVPKECTLEAHGLVDGQPTSRHYDLRIYDDVVTMESVSTPDQIAKTTYAWQMSDNLGKEGGRVRYIGTFYHLFDTYRTMIDSKSVKLRKHPATHNGREDGKPVLLSQKTLEHKRKVQGPYVYSSQMLLDPIADKAMGFRREWLQHSDIDYASAMRSLFRIIIVDPAGGKQRENNDYTTFWVLGYGADGIYRVLQVIRDRLRLTQRWQVLYELHVKWKPNLVAYEEYGMQADIEHFQFCMQQKLYQFDIVPLGGNMPKKLRIMRLVPYFENGWKEGDDAGKSRIILPTICNWIDYEGRNLDMVKVFVEEEYTAFPVLSHDDMIDGLARLVDLEQMKLIQAPSVNPTQGTRTDLATGMKKLGQSNQSSWMTA